MASGLFQRAIIQSGQCITDLLAPLPFEEGVQRTNMFLNQTGASSVSDLITNITAEELVQQAGWIFGTPALDNLVMSVNPYELYSNPDLPINPDDLIAGSTTFDDPMLLMP